MGLAHDCSSGNGIVMKLRIAWETLAALLGDETVEVDGSRIGKAEALSMAQAINKTIHAYTCGEHRISEATDMGWDFMVKRQAWRVAFLEAAAAIEPSTSGKGLQTAFNATVQEVDRLASTLSASEVEGSMFSATCVACIDNAASFAMKKCKHLVCCIPCRRKLVHGALMAAGGDRSLKFRRALNTKALERTIVGCPICRTEGYLVKREKLDEVIVP